MGSSIHGYFLTGEYEERLECPVDSRRFRLVDPSRSAMGHVIRRCNANTDCKEDECCLQKPWSNRFFCAKRVREGKVCWSKQHNATANWDKYRVICPCIAKHECRFQEPILVLKPVLAASTCQPKMEMMR
ncbi:hypothetical protein TNCT_558201 [Trichonephila clavata]|uniref:Uncharacterized protein n=1 Tax=Trichonephila clavata TaxID=2740835 RepID=A0A8X6HP61_TRICU|nr:hypothetical protein TNCT_558201 [Trichonephila clavata]